MPKFRHQLDLYVPDFSMPREFSDVVLIVEDKPIHCSKYVLSEVSPVFKSMFSSEFKEKTAQRIPLPGKKYDEMLTVMQIIHPPTDFREVNAHNVESILAIADEYQMSHLVKKCEEVMLGIITQKNAMKYLWLAQEHGLTELYQKVENACANKKLDVIKRSEYFSPLYEDNKVELLSNHIKILNETSRRVLDSISKVVENSGCKATNCTPTHIIGSRICIESNCLTEMKKAIRKHIQN